MKVQLLTSTHKPENIIALAANTCYSAVDISNMYIGSEIKDPKPLIEKLKSMGHWSPFEHASFTFGIEGISRSCSHQLVRHRLASYSQKSQRYVKEVAPRWIAPEGIVKSSLFPKYLETCKIVLDFYKEMCDNGISEEDARYILPNATDTQIVMTMNARELIHFCQLRMCNRAQLEIQELATGIAAILIKEHPAIFKGILVPRCLSEGKCPEGDFKCSRPLPQVIKDMK